MTINKTVQGKEATLKLEGWLDTQAAPQLEEEVDKLEDGIESLVLDLNDLEYISSAGLRQIVATHKKMDGNMTIANVSVEIMNIFKMTGFEKRLHFNSVG